MAATDVLSIYNPYDRTFSVYADEDLSGWGLGDILHALHDEGEDEAGHLSEDGSIEQDTQTNPQKTGAGGAKEPDRDDAPDLAVDGQATVLM